MVVLLGLSGRGDKDMAQFGRYLERTGGAGDGA
jgi:hypothetical protein